MRSRIATVVIGLALLVAGSAGAFGATWIVAKDGTGDFSEIQDAIDAAAPGDLILVKDGEYQPIVVDKALSIVGSGPERTVVDWETGTCVRVSDVASGEVLLASLGACGTDPFVTGRSPKADLIGWNLGPRWPGNVKQGAAFTVVGWRRVWLNGVIQRDSGSTNLPSISGLYVNAETLAFASQCRFQSYDALEIFYGMDGGPGIEVIGGATAYIAETDAIGGKGALGYHVDCQIFYPAGDGGDGILVDEASHVQVFGRAETVIQAGAGGEGDDLGWGTGCYPPGGDGGDGIHSTGGSVVTTSGVFPEGAPGGYGEPPGQDGVPASGDVTEITPRLPTSTMQGDGKPGSTAVFSFHAAPGDLLRVVYSTEIDVFDLPNVDGHPLMPSPAGTFGAVSLGTVDSSGTASVVFQLPADAPPGTPFFVQGLLTSADHAPQLTNMSMLVVSMP